MVKKIKKNSSYSYTDRNVAPAKNSSALETKAQDVILDVDGEDASYVKRLIAYLVDLAIYLPLALIFQYATATMREQGNDRNALYMTICIIIYAFLMFGYLPNLWKGQTLGKKLLKIRIVPTNGKRIDFASYLIREFLLKITVGIFVVPAIIIFFVAQKFVLKEEKPRLIHDRIMRTRVVNATAAMQK